MSILDEALQVIAGYGIPQPSFVADPWILWEEESIMMTVGAKPFTEITGHLRFEVNVTLHRVPARWDDSAEVSVLEDRIRDLRSGKLLNHSEFKGAKYRIQP